MLYPAGVYVESTLRVWAMSRWRGARGFTDFFLGAGYRHLPRGSPRMYRVEEVIHNGVVVAILLSPPIISSRTTTTSSPPTSACTLCRTPSTTPRRS
uniref:Uncharacterized protein n=1 Tax=Aegilops tauschii subsp. strangulata TaxID=200361 RepID=A0A452YU75_AEGTS